MTIYTPSQADKKPSKEIVEPEVVTEPLTGLKKAEVEICVVKRVAGYRSKRCHLVGCLVVILLCLGAVGTHILYKHLTNKGKHHEIYQGWCGTEFYDELYHNEADPEYQTGDENLQNDFLEEDYKVNVEEDFEELHTPKFDEVRESYVFHDFAMNYTAVIDHLWQRCYITGLRRSILRPSDFVIQIRDASGSMLRMKTLVIREDYIMVVPTNLHRSPFGQRIARICAHYDTYWLEVFVSGVVKRSVHAPPVATYAILTNNATHQEMYKFRIHESKVSA